MAKKRLARGMDTLFMDSVEESGKDLRTLRVSALEPNKKQPRTRFDQQAIAELAESVQKHGVLQPLLVRPLENGSYQIVAGERRWRAARMAGLQEVPVVIRELSDKETAQIALIENLQREDLDPIEEAKGFKGLIDEFGMTQNEVAETVGISRASVANSLRLLELEENVMQMLQDSLITVGHAKALLGVADKQQQLRLAKEAAEKKLTVRQTEQAVASLREDKPSPRSRDGKYFERPAVFGELEIALRETLGQKVEIISGKNGSSQVKISFADEDSLKEFARRLSR